MLSQNVNKDYFNWIIQEFTTDIPRIAPEDFDKRSSVTSKGGRPYMYSPREIGEAMSVYFFECIEAEQPMTVTGLCLKLGMSRRGFLKLEKSSNDKFVPIIEKGKQIIETYLEIQCHLKENPYLSIFVLKNMGWNK